MYNIKGLIVLLFLTILISCDNDDQIAIVENAAVVSNEATYIPNDGEMILGKKFENPYEIKNMQEALKILKKKNKDAIDFMISPNYVYVRFLPKDLSEYNKINGDQRMDVFEYPLDYEIIKEGSFYKDKSLGDSEFGYIYAAVPFNMEFDKKIKKEILAEMFLPDGNGREDEYFKTKQNKSEKEKSILEALENEALDIFGDEILGSKRNNKGAKVQGRYASGRIRVWDERLTYNESTGQYIPGSGQIPVPGCQVRANVGFTTKTTLTNLDGTFFINHFWSVNCIDMSIKWDRNDFDIRTGSYGQAITSNNNVCTAWNPDITESISPNHYIYAHVHRAAWYYYYNNIFNVPTPPTRTKFDLYGISNLVGEKMHLGAKEGGARSHYFQFNGNWLASQIKLNFDITTDSRHDARYIFNATIHELTHASHWDIGMNYPAYISNAGQAARLAESWADGVAWHSTQLVYGNVIDPRWNAQVDNANQMLSIPDITSTFNYYTPLFIDLMDNFNQGDPNLNPSSNKANLPIDIVSGYTMSQLQSFLNARPTNWYMYRDYLETNSTNVNESQAIQLFSIYD
jgi:hypothetical protein